MELIYYTKDNVPESLQNQMNMDAEKLNEGFRKQLKGLTSSKLARILGKKISDRADVQFYTNQMKLITNHDFEQFDNKIKITITVDDTFVLAWKTASPYTFFGKFGDKANDKLIYKIIRKGLKDYVKLCKVDD